MRNDTPPNEPCDVHVKEPVSNQPAREPNEPPDAPALHARGRLITTLPAKSAPFAWPLPPGVHTLGALGSPDSLVQVPAGCSPAQPLPLVLLLHGAGGRPEHTAAWLDDAQDDAVVIAPKSHEATWDALGRGYGDDVALIDRLLAWTLQRVAIDTDRIVIGGFSDGASYALSLGLLNPQLFTHVLAFSPGCVLRLPQEAVERPRVFVSHGRADHILPLPKCSGHIVPALRAAGYEVRYLEFDGGHEVPVFVRREGVRWVREG
jgi:predicted esterase